MVDIKKLKNNPKNPRRISKEALERLKGKLERNLGGLEANKIVYKQDGIIYAGNQRYKALKALKVELKPEWFLDATGWTDEQIREYVITSNVSDGEYDVELLLSEFDEVELDELGVQLPPMDDAELEKINLTEDEELGGKNAPAPKEQRQPRTIEVICPNCDFEHTIEV